MAHIMERDNIFMDIRSRQIQLVSGEALTITLKDGKELVCDQPVTPMHIAEQIFKKNATKYIVAKVNSVLYDMFRPLENNCTLEFLTFDDPEGKQVFWHSSAHLLGLCCETLFNCLLDHGPATKDGFFYDMDVEPKMTSADFDKINTLANKFISDKVPFERLTVSKNDLRKIFYDNPMKLHFINEKIADGSMSTVYKCGDLIDLCLGPHLSHTGLIKVFSCTNLSTSYWLGDSKNMSLTRVYGISFPDNKMMLEWKKREKKQKLVIIA